MEEEFRVWSRAEVLQFATVFHHLERSLTPDEIVQAILSQTIDGESVRVEWSAVDKTEIGETIEIQDEDGGVIWD